MKKKKKGKTQRQCICMAAAIAVSNILPAAPASAETLEFTGVTQIPTNDCYLDADTSAVELTVEEVYAAAGDYLEEGTPILKLTSDSFQEATDYYEAAILRADHSLTDTRLAYDQGVLKSKYTYEEAMAEAENAEFIKEYQSNEVASALTDHETVLADIADRIAELEEGIADGSYEASGSSAASGSSGGMSSGGSAGTSAGASGQTSDKLPGETSSEKSENEPEAGGEQNNTEAAGVQKETDSQEKKEEPAGGQQTETNQTESDQTEPQQTENGQTEDGDTPESGKPEADPSDGDKTLGELKSELASLASEAEALEKKIAEELQNATEKLSDNTDNDNTGDFATYADQLNHLISQLTADIQTQQNVQTSLNNGDDPRNAQALEESIQGNSRVLESLEDIQQRVEKYQTIISALLTIMDTGSDTVLADGVLLSDISDYLAVQEECKRLYASLIDCYEKELAEKETESSGETEGSGSQQEETGKDGGQQEETETREQDGNGEETDSSGAGDAQTADTGKPDAGNSGTSGSEAPGGETAGAGSGKSDSGTSGSEAPGGEAAGAGSGKSDSGTSGSGMSGSGTAAGGSASGESAGTGQSASGAQMNQAAGQSGLSGTDISLLGDAYDLTTVKNLLSREPSDSDDAQELIEELLDSEEEVQAQYQELQRKLKIFELEIQYTCDTAVINAKLAEITYQQEMKEWEETLAEAQQAKAVLEEQKAYLASLEDGVITADRSGTAASVYYEADDILSADVPVISYYDTDVVTVTIEAGQEDIAKLSVGDPADVTVAGYGKYEGVLTGKSVEPESGTSRTTVNYTVEISIDNEKGRLASGMSAGVTVSTEENTEEEETEAEEEKVNES